MKVSIMISTIIISLFLLPAMSAISPHCQMDDEFNQKFIRELEGKSLTDLYTNEGTTLGNGSFGDVKAITWKDSVKGQIKVAVKRIAVTSDAGEKNLVNEIDNLFFFQGNPYIMQILGCMELKPANIAAGGQPSRPVVYVITEILFADFDSQRVRNIMATKTPVERKKVYLEVAKALKSMHDKKIIHNDVKPPNFMAVDGTLNSVKIIDLGLSNKAELPLGGGTLNYAAPEYFQKGLMRPAVDIYAWAVSVAHMEFGLDKITEGVYFLRLDGMIKEIPTQVTKNIKSLMQNSPMFENPDPSKDSLSKIISDCLKTYYYDRPTDEQLVSRLSRVIADERGSLINATTIIDSGVAAKNVDVSNAVGAAEKKSIDFQRSNFKQDNLSDNKSSMYMIAAAGFLLMAIAVPIGLCLSKKRQQ